MSVLCQKRTFLRCSEERRYSITIRAIKQLPRHDEAQGEGSFDCCWHHRNLRIFNEQCPRASFGLAVRSLGSVCLRHSQSSEGSISRPIVAGALLLRKLIGVRHVLVALRRIEPGEEVTYDYGRQYVEYFLENSGCHCAAYASLAARALKSRLALASAF